MSFSRTGGANSSGVDLSDSNFLGSGKTLSIAHSSNVDRTSNGVTYADPNLLGSRWTLTTAYADASDGAQRTFALAQPFYSLDTPWSATLKAIQYDRTVSRYNLGDIVDQFKRDENYYEVSGGLSSGLVDGWTRRIYGGVHASARYDYVRYGVTAESYFVLSFRSR